MSPKKKGTAKETRRSAEFRLSEDSPFAVQEAYKALRTNLIFSLPGSSSKCIGITSSGQSEGKSQNILNLAISFGQLGKKVLLIDCDMRLPTIAAKLGIPGRPGLSELLVGQSEGNEVIYRIEESNIDVPPSGTIPPDPTSLLESEQMGKTLEILRKVYDYIFIDLPPVTVVTDAAILAKYLDGFLLVVKHNQSTYRAVSAMLNQLRFADAKILGFVYVNAEADGKKYYRGYYGYGK